MPVEVGQGFQELMALGHDVAAALNVEDALRAVTRAATEITAPSAVSFWTADERTRTLSLAAVSDEAIFADLPLTTLRFGEGLAGEVARTRRSVRVRDVFADERLVFADWHRRHGLRSCDGLPIVFKDSILGVLTYSRREPLADDDEVRDVLAFFADQAAIVIRNARRLEGLLDVNRQLSSIQSVDTLLATIAEVCGRLLGADFVALRVVDGDELVLKGTWGDADRMSLAERIGRESLPGAVVATGRPLNVANALEDPRQLSVHREAVERFGYRGLLGVPVKVGERVLGVLSIRTRRAEAYSASDVGLASAFASQAAVALDNARLAGEHAQLYARLAGQDAAARGAAPAGAGPDGHARRTGGLHRGRARGGGALR